uniref:hypothetical protein n=1 Tax=Microbispora cellulosiformans TaxID=2614688 RepID=UPI001784DDB0|nr:hypothetical protein [Microbispora cellulosiformans]
MTDPADEGARAAAHRLAARFGPSLIADVEATLHHRGTGRRPDQYFDPVPLGELIVAAAGLAFSVYTYLKGKTDTPSKDAVARAVRTELRRTRTVTTRDDEIVTVTVEETLTVIEALSEPAESRTLQKPNGES